jgi:hypothetical protein
MYDAPYELGSAADGYPVRIRARGRSVLSNPMLNRGTAFTPEQRQLLGLQGLQPSDVTTLEGQLRRCKPSTAANPMIWPRMCFGQHAGPQRGAVLPAAGRAPGRDATDRLHPYGRESDRTL